MRLLSLLPKFAPAESGACGRQQPAQTTTNLGRDLPLSGKVRFTFIPFRYGTSLRTGTCGRRWGGRRRPSRTGQAVPQSV